MPPQGGPPRAGPQPAEPGPVRRGKRDAPSLLPVPALTPSPPPRAASPPPTPLFPARCGPSPRAVPRMQPLGPARPRGFARRSSSGPSPRRRAAGPSHTMRPGPDGPRRAPARSSASPQRGPGRPGTRGRAHVRAVHARRRGRCSPGGAGRRGAWCRARRRRLRAQQQQQQRSQRGGGGGGFSCPVTLGSHDRERSTEAAARSPRRGGGEAASAVAAAPAPAAATHPPPPSPLLPPSLRPRRRATAPPLGAAGARGRVRGPFKTPGGERSAEGRGAVRSPATPLCSLPGGGGSALWRGLNGLNGREKRQPQVRPVGPRPSLRASQRARSAGGGGPGRGLVALTPAMRRAALRSPGGSGRC